MVSKGQFLGLDWNRIAWLHSINVIWENPNSMKCLYTPFIAPKSSGIFKCIFSQIVVVFLVHRKMP